MPVGAERLQKSLDKVLSTGGGGIGLGVGEGGGEEGVKLPDFDRILSWSSGDVRVFAEQYTAYLSGYYCLISRLDFFVWCLPDRTTLKSALDTTKRVLFLFCFVLFCFCFVLFCCVIILF